MLERVIQIGAKGKGMEAVKAQRDSYLDILTCLSLVEDKVLAFANRSEDLDFVTLLRNMKKRQKQKLERQRESGEEMEQAGEDESSRDKWKMVVPPENAREVQISTQIRTYDEALRECELCNCLLLLEDKLASDPIRFNDGKRRAVETVEYLALAYRFDDAIKLARMWDISVVPVIRGFATVCVNLNYDIAPTDGDPAEYVRFLDVSELPNSGTSVVEMALMILQNYVKKYEKPKETYVHQEVALEFLSYNINLPRWLLDSYKKRDAAQLLNCYLRYGELEEATTLAVDIVDATLGRRDAKEFDPSIETVTPHLADPILPYTMIDLLAADLTAKKEKEPRCEELLNTLKRRCDDYVIRVNETRRERLLMFSA